MKILGLVVAIFLVFCTFSLAHASWIFKYHVDDFGEFTGEGQIIGKFEGSYSNSFVSNSNLVVVIKMKQDEVRIKLYRGPQCSLEKEVALTAYTVLIKDEEGKIIKFPVTNFIGSINIYDDLGRIHKLLMKSESLQFVVKVDSRPKTKYRFVVKTFNKSGSESSYRTVYKLFSASRTVNK